MNKEIPFSSLGVTYSETDEGDMILDHEANQEFLAQYSSRQIGKTTAMKDAIKEQRRFELAKAAMQGMLSRKDLGTPSMIVSQAVFYADSMLAALEERR